MIKKTKEIARWRAWKSQADEDAWLGPIRALAERLGDQGLCRLLQTVQPAQWYASKKDQDVLKGLLEYWFTNTVAHYLLLAQGQAVRPQYLVRGKDVDHGSCWNPSRWNHTEVERETHCATKNAMTIDIPGI